jgi:hypothetical protein
VLPLNNTLLLTIKGTVQQKLTKIESGIHRGLPFAWNCWYFVFTFIRNLLLKSQKTGFSSLSHNMVLSYFDGHPLRITDGGKQASGSKVPAAIQMS